MTATLTHRLMTGVALGALALALSSHATQARDRALIIGVNEYMNSDNDLHFARSDAEKFRDFVIQYLNFPPEDVVTLFDTDATGDNVRKAIVEHLIKGTEPGDRVVFYYSGHGSRFEDRNGDEDDGYDEAIVLSDAHVDPASGIFLDDEFEVAFEYLKDRQALLVFDSCYSGTIQRQIGGGGGPDFVARYTTVEGYDEMDRDRMPPEALARSNAEAPLDKSVDSRMIWTAAAASQPAWEDRKSGGIFTTYFLEGLTKGLADANRNGQVTNSELLTYVNKYTERACAQNPNCDKGFTPTFTGRPEDLAGLLIPGSLAPVSAQPSQNQQGNTQNQQVAVAPATPQPQPPASQQPPAQQVAAPVRPPQPPAQQTQPTEPVSAPSAPPATPTMPTQPVSAPVAAPPSFSQPGAGTPEPTLAVLTDVFATENTAGVTLDLVPGRDLRIGQTVEFRVTAEKPGLLLLFDLDPQGNLYQLFPSQLSAEGVERIQPGEVLSIPEARSVNDRPLAISVTEPAGRGQLLALLIEDPAGTLSGFEVLPQSVAPGPVPNASQYLMTLAMSLQTTLATASGNRPVRWSAAYTDYVISR